MAQTHQARFVQNGQAVDHTPGSDVAAGDVVIQNNLVGIPKVPIEGSVVGALALGGVYDIVKKQEAFASVGANIWWDATGDPYEGEAGTGAATATPTSNTWIGMVLETAEATDETVRILLRSTVTLTGETFALSDLSDIDAVLYTAGRMLLGDGAKYADQPMSGDATIDGTGAITLADALTAAIADPGDAGAISVAKSGTCPLVTAGAETRTLAIPDHAGQLISLGFKTDVDDCVITVASGVNVTGNTILTFANAGEHIVLAAIENGAALAWRVVCNDGVALSGP